MKQKLIFAAALLVLCTPLLTACAGKNKPDDPASVGVSDGNSQSGKDPAAGVNVKEDPADLKDAQKTLEKFFDACKRHRNDAVMGFSNVERIPEFSAVAGVNLSAEESQNAIQSAIDTYSNLDDYKIETGSLNKAAIGTYAGYLAEAKEIGGFLRENGDGAIADAADKLFTPIEKIYSSG